MKEKLKILVNKKSFHVIVIASVITAIIFIAGIIILKYNVEGEKNMPFKLDKISVISFSEGIDKETTDTKWAFDVYQSNDIYLYISKNENYEETQIIKNINIDNINIQAENKENIRIYRPDSQDEKVVFKNKEENIIDKIEYLGDIQSDLKQLKISNQGGIVAFRCSNDNLAEYKSDEEQINHNELLKKANITNERLKMDISFDLTIKLEDAKEYKSTINLKLPIGDIVNEGTTAEEITDLSDFIFKRVKNT